MHNYSPLRSALLSVISSLIGLNQFLQVLDQFNSDLNVLWPIIIHKSTDSRSLCKSDLPKELCMYSQLVGSISNITEIVMHTQRYSILHCLQ